MRKRKEKLMKRLPFQEQSPVKSRLMMLSSLLKRLNQLSMRIGSLLPKGSQMKSKMTMKLRMKLIEIQLKVKHLTIRD